EPDHVPGLAGDLRVAPDLRRDHRGRHLLLRASGGDALVAAAPRDRAERDLMAVLADPEFWMRLLGIGVLNLLLSGDNALVIVLALAATAHGDLLLVMFGIGLSLPIVIWGAGLLALLMNRYTWIVWLGGGLLGYVAGEMLIEDPVLRRWFGDGAAVLRSAVPIGIGVAVTGLGWWL